MTRSNLAATRAYFVQLKLVWCVSEMKRLETYHILSSEQWSRQYELFEPISHFK